MSVVPLKKEEDFKQPTIFHSLLQKLHIRLLYLFFDTSFLMNDLDTKAERLQ